MEEELITVIVPIYNVGEYLDECITSIINQKYKKLEILLIDDGSTDSSAEISDKYSKKDKRIKVFHKKNGGLSDARNFGIEKSSGNYICFIDGDDFVTDDYVSSMFENIKKYDVKIVACGFCKLYGNNIRKEINFQNIKRVYEGDECQIYLNIIGYYNVSACNKLFKKDLFDEIRFPVGAKSEDWFVMYKIVEKAQKIYYNSDTKYIYRQRSGSITRNTVANVDSIKAARTVYEYFSNENIKKYAAQSLAFAIIGVYNHLLCSGNKQKRIKLKKEFNCVYVNLTYSKLSMARKIQLFLFRYMLCIYNILFLGFNNIRNLKGQE